MAPESPRINGALVFGVRPGSPILYSMPVTGVRPMTYSARGLPKGAVFDAATGRISGAVETPGTYHVILGARNSRGSARRQLRLVVGDTIGLTPPLGWNSYNVWSDQVTQERALAAARAMVSSGLADHGWTYINLDDGWQGRRATEGRRSMQPDLTRFPDMKGMIDEIHGMGLKVGIYDSPWVLTYANRLGGSAENPEGAPQEWPRDLPKNAKKLPFAIGQYRFTQVDAEQFAEWGIDYLKYDWGPVEYPETKEMYDALRAQRRDIFFSLSNNHVKNLLGGIDQVSTVANAWRTTTDIVDNWGRVANDIGFAQDPWAKYARPGHFNDADMLVVGVVGWGQDKLRQTRLTPNEQYSHVSMWSLLASPLLMGSDLTRLDAFTLSLLTNDEVLAVNQDPLVKQATRVAGDETFAVYKKEMEDGSIAVGLFNRGPADAVVTANWSDLGITGRHKVRDLWRQQDQGAFKESFSSPVASHGVRLVLISKR
jgi:alpha-galactosidase